MNLKNIFFCILGILLGEIALILCTTIAQEVLFNGVNSRSSIAVIAFGGLLTFLAAVFAGLISRIIGRIYTITIPSVISFFIILEMTYLVFSDITKDPVWFDILAGIGLISGIWIGYHYLEIKDSFHTQTYYPDHL
ncbi:hypothetical protein [Aquimarina mytili]|uniref:Uncharacterized protein n=1 Tax=Aquimarina mytili TaxID=874423 RepID=A0A936ZY32_9FLAO|nr:hypothetical protein [Aquimarina mytili]MBL0684053.1 hypothetical protein [Aquimarina mytili]